MHPALATLIARFRAAQDRGVAFVVDVLGPTLGVQLPTSNIEWVRQCTTTGLYNARWINGVEVYSHGYGIELIFPDLLIDFDWGDAGESDGFDAWRLWHFARSNPSEQPCPTSAEVRTWLADAAHELASDRLLYYSQTHRNSQVAVKKAQG